MHGVVARIVQDRGFLFIRGVDSQDYFCHMTSVEPPLRFHELQPGDAVEYDAVETPRGPRAEHVTAE